MIVAGVYEVELWVIDSGGWVSYDLDWNAVGQRTHLVVLHYFTLPRRTGATHSCWFTFTRLSSGFCGGIWLIRPLVRLRLEREIRPAKQRMEKSERE